MRISKYIAAFILFVLFVVLNTILGSTLSLSNVYRMNVANRDDISVLEMDTVAKKHDVFLFTCVNQRISLQKDKCIYYTSEEKMHQLWDQYLGLKPGIVKSPIGREYEVIAGTFEELEKDLKLKLGAQSWYMIGDEADCKAVILELKNEYDYSIKDFPPSTELTHIIPYVLFIFILILLLLYCYLDSSFEKKEVSIRVLHGDSVLFHYIRLSLIDSIMFSFLFFICVFAQTQYTQLLQSFTKVYWLYLPFLFGIWIVNLHLLRIKPKEMLYGHQLSSKLLSMLTIFDKVAAVLSCIGILSSFSSLPSIQKYQKAETLFQQRQDYMFMEFVYDLDVNQKMIEDTDYLIEQINTMRQFFKETDEIFEPICINDLAREKSSIKNVTWDAIYCNFRALPYLQSVIPESVAVDITQYDMALLVPNTLSPSDQQQVYTFLVDRFSKYEGYTPPKENILTYYYTPDEEILCFNSDYDSQFTFYDCPAICIASNTYQKSDIGSMVLNHDKLGTGTIYQIPEQATLDRIFDDYPFRPVVTSVYEKFKIDYQVQKTLLMLSILITILVLVFYTMVLQIVLKLDYQVNAVELAIKKTLGYSVFQKNSRHFVDAIVSGVANVIVSICYLRFVDVLPTVVVIAVPIALLILNMILIYILIVRIEKQKLSKILKGGAL